MVTKLDELFRFHEVALGLRAARQQVLASNLANADTPNYKARDIDFNAALGTALAARDGSAAPGAPQLLFRVPAQASVDGNTVEMDAERAQLADNAVHYEADLTIVTMQIKTMLSAIQG
jgi:flagellar basal-body rod protein FlgB